MSNETTTNVVAPEVSKLTITIDGDKITATKVMEPEKVTESLTETNVVKVLEEQVVQPETQKKEEPKMEESLTVTVLAEKDHSLKHGFAAGELTGKSEEFLFDPEEIIVHRETNVWASPHTDEQINDRIKSILEFGQITAGVVRKVEGKRPELVCGELRLLAILKINSDPELLAQAKVTKGYSKVMFRAKCKDMSDEDAQKFKIAENRDRREWTPLDNAYSQKYMMDRFGWNQTQVAEFWGHSLGYVSQLKQLTLLPAAVQKAIKDEQIPVQVAVKAKDLPEEEQKEILQQATNPETKKVDAGVFQNLVRKKKTATGGKVQRSVAEIKKILTKVLEVNDCGRIHDVTDLFLKLVEGSVTDDVFESDLLDLLDDVFGDVSKGSSDVPSIVGNLQPV